MGTGGHLSKARLWALPVPSRLERRLVNLLRAAAGIRFAVPPKLHELDESAAVPLGLFWDIFDLTMDMVEGLERKPYPGGEARVLLMARRQAARLRPLLERVHVRRGKPTGEDGWRGLKPGPDERR
jgi:hypothetical protein